MTSKNLPRNLSVLRTDKSKTYSNVTHKKSKVQQPLTFEIISLQNLLNENLDWHLKPQHLLNLNSQSHLKSSSVRQNDLFYLNRKKSIVRGDKLDIELENLDKYKRFLQFCIESLSKFNKSTETQKSYYMRKDDRGDSYNMNSFYEIAKNYKKYKFGKIPSYQEILKINEDIIDELSSKKNFDEKTDEEILKILEDRIKGLEVCSVNPRKSAEELRYYQEEFQRETQLLEKSKDLSEISDGLNWSPEIFIKTSFNQETARELYNFIITSYDSQNKINKLATFLPLDLFDIDPETNILSLNEGKFISFVVNDAGIEKKNIQQLVLGLGEDLFLDPFKKKKFNQLFLNMVLNVNYKNLCHELVDHTSYLNLFYVFMMSKSQSKVFPITFKLPKKSLYYDDKTKSYSFRKSRPYVPNLLFGENSEFLGVHLFKYEIEDIKTKQKKQKTLFIFTFKNKLFKRDSVNSINILSWENKERIAQDPNKIISWKTREELQFFNTNLFSERIESDEISGNVGVAHQEFYDMFKYYKLKPYIIGDSYDELFITNRDDTNPELIRLKELLNMRAVKIVKKKFIKNSTSRFQILSKEATDSNSYYELEDTNNISELPLSGGYSKTHKKHFFLKSVIKKHFLKKSVIKKL